LTLPSGTLVQSDAYNYHLGRLAELSLHANVFLKALPPVVDTQALEKQGQSKWWENEKEVERVLRMYGTCRAFTVFRRNYSYLELVLFE
jgi:hypothetical protein